MHIETDDAIALIHSAATSAANVQDTTQADQSLNGQEEGVWADAGRGVINWRDEHRSPKVDWQIALRPGWHRLLTASSI